MSFTSTHCHQDTQVCCEESVNYFREQRGRKSWHTETWIFTASKICQQDHRHVWKTLTYTTLMEQHEDLISDKHADIWQPSKKIAFIHMETPTVNILGDLFLCTHLTMRHCGFWSSWLERIWSTTAVCYDGKQHLKSHGAGYKKLCVDPQINLWYTLRQILQACILFQVQRSHGSVKNSDSCTSCS